MIANIMWTFLGVLALAGTFFTLYGLTLFILGIRNGKPPIDKSNIWNRLIAPFYVARHPEVFGGIEFWKNDVGENIRLVQQAVLGRLSLPRHTPNRKGLRPNMLQTTPSSIGDIKRTGNEMYDLYKGSLHGYFLWNEWANESDIILDFSTEELWDSLTKHGTVPVEAWGEDSA